MAYHIRFARLYVRLMDRYGVDPLLSLIPGLGNVVGLILSCYVFWLAKKLRVPKTVFYDMAKNIGVDFLLGSVPYAGVVFDFLYKANVKNLALLKPYLHEGQIID